jgi:hypothetical protein
MADQLTNGPPASLAGTPSDTLFAFRAPPVLPGSTRLRYAFGMAHHDQIGGPSPTIAPPMRGRQRRAWARWVPKADFGTDDAWVARELQWDAYLLRSASVYEELC